MWGREQKYDTDMEIFDADYIKCNVNGSDDQKSMVLLTALDVFVQVSCGNSFLSFFLALLQIFFLKIV